LLIFLSKPPKEAWYVISAQALYVITASAVHVIKRLRLHMHTAA
jgi:hypothetical protein